jgi:hypothetical protein
MAYLADFNDNCGFITVFLAIKPGSLPQLPRFSPTLVGIALVIDFTFNRLVAIGGIIFKGNSPR